MISSVKLVLFFLFLCGTPGLAQLKLVPQAVRLADGTSLQLRIPEGYRISVAAEGMRRLRFLAKSPDGRLFGTDMFDKSDNLKGRVYLFTGWDKQQHVFRKKIVFASGLRNPNQVAFYSANGKHYIYIAETHQLTRYEYHPGDTVVSGKGKTIATFPDYGLSYKYGGWHLTRSICFSGNNLYVSVGSSCNACIEKESIRATVVEMNADGSGEKIYATGLRNSVGIKWVNNSLWVTSMGRDLIGPDKPEDLFHTVERGKFYGWPYYFQYRGRVYPDMAMMDSAKRKGISPAPRPPLAYCAFKAHVAPLGFDHFAGFSDAGVRNNFLVALHGSTSVWRQRGNSIVMVKPGGKYEDVVTGFLEGKTEKDRKGRPCDVLMHDDQSFFFTDDHKGVLYYVWKERR
jgi:glucose/arabinose dehydrogenase